eukprot:gene2761-2802_t
MTITTLESFVEGHWRRGDADLAPIRSAVSGEIIAEIGSRGIDFAAAAAHARKRGGPTLRKLTFHQRAALLKALGQAILDRKEELYDLSYTTGATRQDGWIDIEGGAGTLFAYSSKGRRELPNGHFLLDGEPEILSKKGSFIGQHVYTPLQGVAVHINAFNFPVWGMLEKLAPALLAGMPAIVKPASATAQVAEAAFRILIESNILPEGALQLICGSTGDLLDHLTAQDLVAFTGSATTAAKLQGHHTIAAESVRFTAERDSLNASILGPDAAPGTPEFDLFIKEVAREMTSKTGQKCTAIRRALVPATMIDDVQHALATRLAKTTIGDPRLDTVRMGALASLAQRDDVRANIEKLTTHARIVHGDPNEATPLGDNVAGGAFMNPILLRADHPWLGTTLHETEAFGPVATLMPYTDIADALALANAGKGSLVLSVFTHNPEIARETLTESAAWHGRILFADRDSAAESTGHGSPLPVLTHGGPGRAGGGEELGGIRGVKHHMQRSALQGSPALLTKILDQQMPGAPITEGEPHPFRLRFGEITPGRSIRTAQRTVTLEDIEHFAHFTGDTFYAHMDEEAAKASPIFGGRVAHGYLILSFAAGLFVDPAPGPVLANYGLENLRLTKPLKPGNSIQVLLTAKSKQLRTAEMGEVRWHATVTDESDDTVASYDLLTMNAV